jgi:N6-L-threonylcarbamoyladenine synthase
VLVLGIETSCDETAAAVVDETGLVHSDVVHSQVGLHAAYGGVVPELASRDHLRNVGPVVRAALDRAGILIDAVDGVAVTHRPGLVGALLVGVQAAKGIAWAAGKPLVGVDHLIGHLAAVYLRRDATDGAGPPLPFVCLLASGGHSAIYRVGGLDAGQVVELGATRDDAAGEAFDKVAKLLGLGYPGGPAIERAAASGDASRVSLIAPMARSTSFELSFSGLKTQVAQLVARRAAPWDATEVCDVCAAFQAAVTTVLAQKVVRAAVREGLRDVVLGGGVAANGELRRRVSDLAASHGVRVWTPPVASCTDNAAMIAYAGALRLRAGHTDDWSLHAESRTALERATRKGGGKR